MVFREKLTGCMKACTAAVQHIEYNADWALDREQLDAAGDC
jgi:hypothetical protein